MNSFYTMMGDKTGRSDNAMCYHNAAVLYTAKRITEQGNGVAMKQVDFSEAQDGEGLCPGVRVIARLARSRLTSWSHLQVSFK